MQRVIIIFLGIAFFFFFMVLIPYFSLRIDSYNLSRIYESLNKTIDDIHYINTAFLDQYKKQSSNVNQKLKEYYHNITNTSTDDKTLAKMAYSDCNTTIVRSQAWIDCNTLLKNQELQKKSPNQITVNATTRSKFADAISRQIKLKDESGNLLDANQFDDIINSLENLQARAVNQTTFALVLNSLQVHLNKLTQDINEQINNIISQMKVLLDRFNPLEAPIVGKLPMGFSEMVAVFSIALSIVFFFLTMIIRDTIHLRALLENSKEKNIKDYISIDPLWIDSKKTNLKSWIVLLVPLILFVASIYMIVNVWYSMPVANDKFPFFIAASDLNRFIYGVLYAISFIIFIFSYWIIINERNKSLSQLKSM